MPRYIAIVLLSRKKLGKMGGVWDSIDLRKVGREVSRRYGGR